MENLGAFETFLDSKRKSPQLEQEYYCQDVRFGF